eukprot:jgi/Ulvmu1/4237/UM191_0010.1
MSMLIANSRLSGTHCTWYMTHVPLYYNMRVQQLRYSTHKESYTCIPEVYGPAMRESPGLQVDAWADACFWFHVVRDVIGPELQARQRKHAHDLWCTQQTL